MRAGSRRTRANKKSDARETNGACLISLTRVVCVKAARELSGLNWTTMTQPFWHTTVIRSYSSHYLEDHRIFRLRLILGSIHHDTACVKMLVSITSRCSGIWARVPSLSPIPELSSRGGARTGNERAAEIEPIKMAVIKIRIERVSNEPFNHFTLSYDKPCRHVWRLLHGIWLPRCYSPR